MFEFILGLFSFLTPVSHDDMHEAAYAQPIRTFTIKTHPAEGRIRFSIPWKGHFSAKNFRTSEAKAELVQIKSTLRKAVSSLPRDHTHNLETLEVYNEEHVSRGMANSHKMLLNVGTIETQEELAAIFIHEMGHVTDLGHMKGHEKSGNSEFWDGKTPIYNNDLSLDFYRISWEKTHKRKAASRDVDFVSGYAMHDPFEDFSEHYVFYRVHGEKFRAMAQKSPKLQQKYDFLKEKVFSGNEFQKKKKLVVLPSKKIWDTTLVDYDIRKDLLSKN